MKYFKESQVLRDEYNNLKVSWHIEDKTEVSIYLVVNGKEELIAKVSDRDKFIVKDYYKNKRCIFMLKADNYHYEIIGERLIPLEGTHNFLDLGGYKSEDGRRVRWDIIYRCDKLSNLTENDILYIKNMKIKTIFDLRSNIEVKNDRDIKFEGIKYINKPAINKNYKEIESFDMISLFAKGKMDNLDVETFIKNSYKNMIFDNSALKEIIEYIINEGEFPIVFHSIAGKDRTGVYSAIILSMLNIPRKIIREDYMSLNYYRKKFNENIMNIFQGKIKSKKKLEILKTILTVKYEYIDVVFDEIDKRYGNMDNYLEKEYGLTKKKRKEIKNRLLY